MILIEADPAKSTDLFPWTKRTRFPRPETFRRVHPHGTAPTFHWGDQQKIGLKNNKVYGKYNWGEPTTWFFFIFGLFLKKKL